MRTVVFMLEEPSAREMLNSFLPTLNFSDIHFMYKVFEGKSDLEKNIERKIRAWRTPNTDFIVLRDQDSADCRHVKSRLVEKCINAGRPDTLVRIACREIESWYLGDLDAVEKGLSIRIIAQKKGSNKFRDPDALGNPAQELSALTSGVYAKMKGSRQIGALLKPETNHSHSFKKFVEGLTRLIKSD